MKQAAAIAILIVVGGCAAAPRYTAQPSIQQEVKIKCVASNVVKNGCRTSHEIAISTSLTQTDPGLPSAQDLQSSSPRPTEY